MRSFLKRLSSRKFITALAVQLASVAAIFWPAAQETLESAMLRIAALVTLLLAALGYGRIEAGVDNSQAGSPPSQEPAGAAPPSAQKSSASGGNGQ
jgi:hypothetical protein